MKKNSVLRLFLLLFILITALPVSYSIDYYICLGSFIDINNSKEYSNDLYMNGVDTIAEKVLINGKYYTRILYNKKYNNFNYAKKDVAKLLGNKVIKDANIRDLWIRSGVFLTGSVSKKTEVQETQKTLPAKKNNEIKEADKKSAVLTKSDVIENTKKENISNDDKVEKESVNETIVNDNKVEVEIEDDLMPPVKKNGIYKIIDAEGYANAIFASDPIELGKEDNYELNVVFTKPEKVYARCYFPEAIGEVEPENFWHEIWIDERMIMRTSFNEAPDPDWDQIQIWITEDEYKAQMEALESGEHTIIIWVMKNEYRGNKAVAEENAAGEIEGKIKEIWVPVRLSKGKFKYIVP